MVGYRIYTLEEREQQDELLRELWSDSTVSTREIARRLHVRPATVRSRAANLGLPARPPSEGRMRGASYRGPRRTSVKKPKAPSLPVGSPTVWPDGWSLALPTENQLRAGR